MVIRSSSESLGAPALLDVFFSREGEAWRVFARPSLYPEYLKQYFDSSYEAYPVTIDMEDLERRLAGVPYERRESRNGGFQIVAQGSAAVAVAAWLSTALASGVRPGSGEA